MKLRDSHPALAAGRTIHRAYVTNARDAARTIQSAKHNIKVGGGLPAITRGSWRGMPIFTLTLEERASCPRTCLQWSNCYGNNMRFATRLDHKSRSFLPKLQRDLETLQRQHPGGFVVRLHVLGDFYSVAYVQRWAQWLAQFPALRIFGYTARLPDSAIGLTVRQLNLTSQGRSWIRFSGADPDAVNGMSAHTIADASQLQRGFICPEQTGKTRACATCGLCWQLSRPVNFLEQ